MCKKNQTGGAGTPGIKTKTTQTSGSMEVGSIDSKKLVRNIARDQAAKGDQPKATDSDLNPPNPTPDPKPIVTPDVPETPAPAPTK